MNDAHADRRTAAPGGCGTSRRPLEQLRAEIFVMRSTKLKRWAARSKLLSRLRHARPARPPGRHGALNVEGPAGTMTRRVERWTSLRCFGIRTDLDQQDLWQTRTTPKTCQELVWTSLIPSLAILIWTLKPCSPPKTQQDTAAGQLMSPTSFL